MILMRSGVLYSDGNSLIGFLPSITRLTDDKMNNTIFRNNYESASDAPLICTCLNRTAVITDEIANPLIAIIAFVLLSLTGFLGSTFPFMAG